MATKGRGKKRKGSYADQIPKQKDKILDELLRLMVNRFEHLVERGFLAPHFLNRMISDPEEILKFVRQNRAVVAESLTKKLSKKIRPTPSQLEAKGIVPRGYFTHGHEVAMRTKHRRKSSAQQDLAIMIKLRPKKEDIIRKGIVKREQMEQFYELDETKLDDINDENDYYDNDNQITQIINNNNNGNTTYTYSNSSDQPWSISILSSLLFKTISEALKKSCIDTQSQEKAVLTEMMEMNNEMRNLRNTLDGYLMNHNMDNHNINNYENAENLVRDQFHAIQEKLLHISHRQNNIQEKLKILRSVESSMVSLQNNYHIRLSTLKKTEMEILKRLADKKCMRDRAMKIMFSEKSYKSWALMKLDYTINIAKEYNNCNTNGGGGSGGARAVDLGGRRMTRAYDDDLKEDIEFVDELEKFLLSLRQISEHQRAIVKDFDGQIEEMEAHLLSIRYDMGKVRTMTFKKIYDLHKQVQIAETLELGYRRLSVASAHEIDKERRHFMVKINRQLTTLNNQIKGFEYFIYEKNLTQIVDIQMCMSGMHTKAYFSVFVQTFHQCIIDIELTYNNINSLLPPTDNGAVNKLCDSLFGIDLINGIESERSPFLNEKLNKCLKFIKSIKKAIEMEKIAEMQKRLDGMNGGGSVGGNVKMKVKTFEMTECITIMACKLCINRRSEIEQNPKLAEIHNKQIFEAILENKLVFKKQPRSSFAVANFILSQVFGIRLKALII